MSDSLITNDRSLLKTPEKVNKIPKDDSFKTCKATMPTPATRRQLRMTPARMSMSQGRKIFREANSSGRKFNTRGKKSRNNTPLNDKSKDDTHGSNETFIRCEQELMFDRDSLEIGNLSSSPKVNSPNKRRQNHLVVKQTIEENSPDINSNLIEKRSSPIKKDPSPTKPVQKSSKSPARKSKSPKKISKPVVISPIKKKMPPPPIPKPVAVASNKPKFAGRSVLNNSNRKFITPQVSKQVASFRVPSSLKMTASKYLDSSKWNNSRITRAQSFKSTAEIERNYFNSLRSFQS